MSSASPLYGVNKGLSPGNPERLLQVWKSNKGLPSFRAGRCSLEGTGFEKPFLGWISEQPLCSALATHYFEVSHNTAFGKGVPLSINLKTSASGQLIPLRLMVEGEFSKQTYSDVCYCTKVIFQPKAFHDKEVWGYDLQIQRHEPEAGWKGELMNYCNLPGQFKNLFWKLTLRFLRNVWACWRVPLI